tara:strand:+ start:183 stop:407 length:225 start_codon:yes stop_codon:yes gene_type:complete
MTLFIKKFFFTLLLNGGLLIVLFIGIQNNNDWEKVHFLNDESIELPISFIVGSGFILGSIIGSIIPIGRLLNKK